MLAVVTATARRVTVPAPSPTLDTACSQLRVTGTSACLGVPVTVADQAPSPAELTARTCKSYSVPLVSPVAAYHRGPDRQTRSTTVQLASTVSSALVSMRRRS